MSRRIVLWFNENSLDLHPDSRVVENQIMPGGHYNNGSDFDEVEVVKAREKAKSAKSRTTILALSDQVEENQERISKIEIALDRMATAQEQLAVAQEATNAMMEEMMAKLDLCLPMVQDPYY